MRTIIMDGPPSDKVLRKRWRRRLNDELAKERPIRGGLRTIVEQGGIPVDRAALRVVMPGSRLKRRKKQHHS